MKRIIINCSTNPFIEIEVDPEGTQVEFRGVDNSILNELIFTGCDNIHLINIPPTTIKTLMFDDSGAILTKWDDKFKTFFPNLTTLKIVGDEIEELPDLPNGLTYLEVSSAGLEVWPKVGEGLHTLILNSNGLEEVGYVPNSLDKLDISDNCIEELTLDRNLITLLVDSLEYLKLDGVIANLVIEGSDLGNLQIAEPGHIQRLHMEAKLFNRMSSDTLTRFNGLLELWLFNFFENDTLEVDLSPLPKLTTLYATPRISFIPCSTLQYVNGASFKSRSTGDIKATTVTKKNYNFPNVVHFD